MKPAAKKIIPYKVTEGADTHIMSLIESAGNAGVDADSHLPSPPE